MAEVDLQIRGTVAYLTLQRPAKLNALTPDMLARLEAHAGVIEKAPDVRAAILTGSGERAFCVGADILAWSALEPLDMWRSWIREGHRVLDRLAALRVPLIAAVNGYCFGGGLELALAADMRLASENAAFAMPEVSIATVPGWGGTTRLPKTIGTARAKEMIFSARRIDAETAEHWGLVNSTVPAEGLLDAARSLAEQIAEQAPVAVQLAKQCIDQGVQEALAGALAATTQDAQEGLGSFKERRKADYKGT